MSDLSPMLGKLVSDAKASDDPTDFERERVHRSLAARLSAAAVVTAAAIPGSSAAATIATHSGFAILAAKILVPLAVLGTIGGAVVIVQRGHSRSEPEHHSVHSIQAIPVVHAIPTQSPRAIVSVVTPEEIPVVPAITVAPVAEPPSARIAVSHRSEPRVAATTLIAEPSAPVASDLVAEIALLRSVNAALHAGEPSRALAMLDGDAIHSHGSALEQERSAARAMALCGVGRTSEGRAAGARFLGTEDQSPLAMRVADACGGR